jgi:hypothetical protein
MNRYKAGQQVKVNVPLTDYDGASVAATSVIYNVKNELDTVVITDTVVTPASGATSIDITVLGSNNLLINTTDIFGCRILNVQILTVNGTYVKTFNYALEGSFELVTMTNSYQTFGQAEINSITMPGLESWDSFEEFNQKRALTEAYFKIGKINFSVDIVSANGTITTTAIPKLNSYTKAEFEALPSDFIEAVRKAQVAEANYVLGGDASERMRKMNIMSYTIGETSQMFRPGSTGSENKLSDEALEYLKGYISYSVSIGRA